MACESVGDGWRCSVTVGEGPSSTEHRVTVSGDDIRRYAPPGTTPEGLVEGSFAFLLEREPRESILREFDLPVIGRYFPEYEAVIRRRLGG